jgi:hypothetical protein
MGRDLPINLRSRLPKEIVRPEDELLLWCIREASDRERSEQIKALIWKGIEWAKLLDASLQHGLVPLVYKSLEFCDGESVPKDVLERFRNHFLKNVLWNLARTRELLELLDLFTRNGIQAIPYKGPLLASMAYGDLSMRQFDDLDIFVPEGSVKQAKKLLLEIGYRTDFLLAGRQEDAYLKSKDEYGFYNNSKKFLVELHWKIVPRYLSIPLDTEEMFGRLMPVSFNDREIMTFCGEDLLLILCIHGGKHGWCRLGWICDVAKVIQASREINWERFLVRARKLKLGRIVSLGLFLAKEVTGTDVPEMILREIDADRAIMGLASRVYAKLFQDASTSDEFFEGLLFTLMLREHWKDKVRYCLDLGLTPTFEDWQSVHLPDSLFSLYYLIRPFRLVLQYGPRLLTRLFNLPKNSN